MTTDSSTFRSWAEIDLAAARANVRAIRSLVGDDRLILATVKADAYGHGAARVSAAIVDEGVDRLAVADTAEARELRDAGLGVPIHVLGALAPAEVPAAVEMGLNCAVGSAAEAERLSAAARELGRTVSVHLHVDTGMGRYGARCEEAAGLAKSVEALPGIEIEGASTHFADAEGSPDFTREQLSRFEQVVGDIRAAGVDAPVLHAANSPALSLLPDSRLNMVRPGLALYGLSYCDEMSKTMELSPIMTWKSRVVFAKTIKAGEPVGYGMTWRAPSDRVIVTVSAGYADGYQRTLTNNSYVLIGGKRCPIAGRVAMDYINVDPSGAQFEVGDEVVLMGRQGSERVPCEELAERAGAIPHVIVTCMGKRTRRVYING